MDVKEAIEKRRSIRRYQDKEVPDEIINELLDAARLAPSAKNTQPNKYYIIKDKNTISKLKEKGAFKQPFVYDAPLLIVCCSDSNLYPSRVDIDDTPEHYAYIDSSIASAFITLRATELGLGSVYIAWTYQDILKEVLEIPDNFIIPFVLSLGYPAEEGIDKPRKEIKDITF